jgi:hypothetical protein
MLKTVRRSLKRSKMGLTSKLLGAALMLWISNSGRASAVCVGTLL